MGGIGEAALMIGSAITTGAEALGLSTAAGATMAPGAESAAGAALAVPEGIATGVAGMAETAELLRAGAEAAGSTGILSDIGTGIADLATGFYDQATSLSKGVGDIHTYDIDGTTNWMGSSGRLIGEIAKNEALSRIGGASKVREYYDLASGFYKDLTGEIG